MIDMQTFKTCFWRLSIREARGRSLILSVDV